MTSTFESLSILHDTSMSWQRSGRYFVRSCSLLHSATPKNTLATWRQPTEACGGLGATRRSDGRSCAPDRTANSTFPNRIDSPEHEFLQHENAYDQCCVRGALLGSRNYADDQL